MLYPKAFATLMNTPAVVRIQRYGSLIEFLLPTVKVCSLLNSKGAFPVILGHEGGGIVRIFDNAWTTAD